MKKTEEQSITTQLKIRKIPNRVRAKRCKICNNTIKKVVDYKDVQVLQRFCNPHGKIQPVKRTHNCMRHQRKVERAIKLARFMALLPYPGM
jgi:small subunit ribosomal protein S18